MTLAAPRPASVTVLLFAAARVAAGTGRAEIEAQTVGDLLDDVTARFGPEFAAVVNRSRVWVNGEAARPDQKLMDGDEVAVLPPVSGGTAG